MRTLSTSAPSCSRHSVLRVRPSSAVWCRTTVSSPGSSASVSASRARRRQVGHLRRVGDAAVVVPGELVGAEGRVPELGDRRAGLLAGEIGEVARGHAPAGGVEDEREGSHGAVHGPTSVRRVTDAETDLTPPEAVLDTVGVGPWPGPWPEDPRYDPELLAARGPAQRRRRVPLLDASRRSSPTSTGAGTPSTWPSRTGGTTSTSGPSSGRRTPSSPRRCTSSGRSAGTGAGRWSPTATSTSGTTPTWPISSRGPREAGCPCWPWTTCREPGRWRRPSSRGPACCSSARRAAACRPRRGGRRRRAVDRPVRLHPVDQRRSRAPASRCTCRTAATWTA